MSGGMYPFTQYERQTVARLLIEEKKTDAEIGQALGRSINAIEKLRSRMGLIRAKGRKIKEVVPKEPVVRSLDQRWHEVEQLGLGRPNCESSLRVANALHLRDLYRAYGKGGKLQSIQVRESGWGQALGLGLPKPSACAVVRPISTNDPEYEL